jgi:hypothetical protein
MTLARDMAELVCPPSGAPGTAAADLAHLVCLNTPLHPPTIVTAPVVTPTTGLNLGTVMHTTDGAWTNSPTSFRYQWLRNGASISGATANTYTLAVADHETSISCRVIARNADGNSSPSSATPIGPINSSPPINSVQPQVTPATGAIAGTVLTTTNGSWAGNTTGYTYQWYRGTAAIAGATASSYTAGIADNDLTCKVSTGNINGTATTASNTITVAHPPPVNTISPSIGPTTGLAVGTVMSVTNNGTWQGEPPINFTYQWQRNQVNITNATNINYTLQTGDVPNIGIRCIVMGTNAVGFNFGTSNEVAVTPTVPVNSVAPSCTTTGVVPGSTFTTSNGTWGGTAPITFTYQWRRTDASNNSFDIASATGTSYVAAVGDIGFTIWCRVFAHNSAGDSQDDSNRLGPIVSSGMTNINPPVVTATNLNLNGVLTVATAPSNWTGVAPITFTNVWRRNDVDTGNTSTSYQLTAVDNGANFICRVTAHDATNASLTVNSNQVGPAITATPINTGIPSVTPTSAVLGTVLTTTNGSWNTTLVPITDFIYQWLRNGGDIPGAQSSTYTVVTADLGLGISCRVTARNVNGNTAVVSNVVTPSGASVPGVSIAPVVTATSINLNGVLTTDNGTWTNPPITAFAYQWQRDGVNIVGAIGFSHTLIAADNGALIRCQVRATNSAGQSLPSNSNAIGPVNTANPSNSVLPLISSSTSTGVWLNSVLTTTNGTWTNATAAFHYQWTRNGLNIGTDSPSYTVVLADDAAQIRCIVTAGNVSGTTAATSSNQLTPITGVPANSVQPQLSPATNVQTGDTITTTNGEWSGSPYQFNYQWRRDGISIGATDQNTYVAVAADEGHAIVCRVSATNGNGLTNKNSTSVTPGPRSGSGFVLVEAMIIDDATRSGDIVTPTFNEQVSGNYQRFDDPVDGPRKGARPSPRIAQPTNAVIDAGGLVANPCRPTVNQIFNFLGKVGFQHDQRTIPSNWDGYQYSMWECVTAGNNSVICGGKTHTKTTSPWLDAPWARAHGEDNRGFNAPGIYISDSSARWQGFYLKDTLDGIIPRADGWVAENICILACRDDSIENDDQYNGTIRNAFIQGHSILSVRPEEGSRTANNLRSITKFENCVIWLKRQPYAGDEGGNLSDAQSLYKNPYTNPTDPNRHARYTTAQAPGNTWYAHKNFAKTHWNLTTYLSETRVWMVNCIIRIDGVPVEGQDQALFPGIGDGSTTPNGSNTGSKYENVTVCVCAPGGWAGYSTAQPASYLRNTLGITLINADGTDEQLAYDTWNAVGLQPSGEWWTANGYISDTASADVDTFSWNRVRGIATSIPVLQTAPVISPNTDIHVDDTLNVSDGEWTNSPTGFSYQWKRDATNVGTNASSYKLVAADETHKMSCVVIASNSVGNSTPVTTTQTDTVLAKVVGGDPFGVVKVHPMRIDLANPGDIIVPNFNARTGNSAPGANGKVYDYRNRVALMHDLNNLPSETAYESSPGASGPDGSAFSGGISRAVSDANYTLSWSQIHGANPFHNDKGFNVANTSKAPLVGLKGDLYIEGFYFDGCGIDGVGPPSAGDRFRTYITNTRMEWIRDDCVQNDSLWPLSHINCYMNGHATLSQRPGATSNPAWTKFYTEYDNCILHARRMPYDHDDSGRDNGAPTSKRVGPYNGPSDRNAGVVTGAAKGWGHKWFFKMSGAGGIFYQLRLKMNNCLLRIDTVPLEGPKVALFPPINNSTGNGSVYNNVTVLWFGGTGGKGDTWNNTFNQTKSDLADWGITVLEADTEANETALWNKWVTTENYWLSQNGWNATNRTFKWNRK